MRSGGRGRVISSSPKGTAGWESEDGEGPTENWEKRGRKEAEGVPGMGQAVCHPWKRQDRDFLPQA